MLIGPMFIVVASGRWLSSSSGLMKALVLIGLQSDFLAGGAMVVPNGDSLIPLANELQGAFRLVVATQQWHPINHRSFALTHKGRVVGERVRVGKLDQLLKPVHCVQNTRGAELSPILNMTRVNKVVRLGTDPDLDDDSAFFDAGHFHSTGLNDFLQEKKVKKIYVLGLGAESAVKTTALDAVGLGYKTWLIEDACRTAESHPDAMHNALEEMKAAGVSVAQAGKLTMRKLGSVL